MSRAHETIIVRHGAPKEQADATLDLRGVKCPMTFVRVKLALEKMGPGRRLEVILDSGEAMHNVPRSVKEEGHRILKVEKSCGGSFSLLIQKNAEA